MGRSRRRLAHPPFARHARAGFSLFEVLAAVAVLGILYTMLATASMNGLQTEGAAQRRLRASLLADQELAQIEQTLHTGGSPEVGTQEREEEEFLVETDIQPLDLTPLLAALSSDEETSPRQDDSAPGLLSVAAGGGAAPLLQIAIRVRWQEGVRELAVERSSFAFDTTAAAPLLESIQTETPTTQAPSGRIGERGERPAAGSRPVPIPLPGQR